MLPIAVLADRDATDRGAGGRRERRSLGRGTRIGIAVDLQPGDAQPGNAVPLDCLLPRHEFLDREVVAPADLRRSMAPLRTASTMTALRRATHRLVSGAGKSPPSCSRAVILPRFERRSVTGDVPLELCIGGVQPIPVCLKSPKSSRSDYFG